MKESRRPTVESARETRRFASKRRVAAVVLCVVAAALVGWALHQIGIALSSDNVPLSCTWSDTDAHTHDESCYVDGQLVCPVPERAEHHHTEDCYETTRELTCPLEEGDEHTHDDSCYETTSTLVCGQEETTGPHYHTDECFENRDGNGGLPAGGDQTITHQCDLKDEEGNIRMRVIAEAPADAFPEGTEMRVTEMDSDAVRDTVSKAIADRTDGKVLGMQALDIAFVAPDGTEVEPTEGVTVRISSDMVSEADAPYLVHIGDDGKGKVTEPLTESEIRERDIEEPAGNELLFETTEFSPYVIASTSTEQSLSAKDGDTFDTITVNAPAAAGIPSGSSLAVTDLTGDDESLSEYSARAADKLGQNANIIGLYDISIVNRDGGEVQPQEAVDVNITMPDGTELPDRLHVVHFGSEDQGIDATVDGATVGFEATGFSVYAVVDDLPPAPVEGEDYGTMTITSIAELAEKAAPGGNGVYVAQWSNYWATNQQYNVNTSGRTGIRKTSSTPSLDTAISNGASPYWFEPVGTSGNQFKIYCLDSNGNPQYVQQSSNSLKLVSQAQATTFTVQSHPNGGFAIVGGSNYCWNMQGGSTGNGFAAWTGATDTNANFKFVYVTNMPDDPYGLDGETFGIAYRNAETGAYGMTATPATSGNQSSLRNQVLSVRNDIVDNSGYMLVSEDDLAEWTFHNVSGSNYYITTEVNGQTKYLTLSSAGVTLVDTPNPSASLFTVTQGTGSHEGTFQLKAGSLKLYLNNLAENGMFVTANATSNDSKTYFNLVRKTDMSNDDFIQYRARKVNLSNPEEVPNGAHVVVYARVWDAAELRYNYYLVNADGAMIPAHASGDMLQWIGGSVNTVTWEFTEYTNQDGSPNYYYELQSDYSGQYLAPQLNGQTLQSDPIGLNLNGRRYGSDYTTIVAWDDPYYDYAALHVPSTADEIGTSTFSQADDFYFAILEPVDPNDGTLTTVPTVDNNEYGISMRMVDYNNAIIGTNRDAGQINILGLGPYTGNTPAPQPNLLQPYIAEGEDYPMTNSAVTEKPQASLGSLYEDYQGTGTIDDVNHLFLQGVYNESGYFEYDSTQNFARLNREGEHAGEFTVYDQLAAIGNPTAATRTHGQFMPYNEIQEGLYSQATNQTSVTQQPLDDTDPRKGEKLYMIPERDADYFFGMEMSAGFTQTPSGLDAWGHDIIFEFSGDDDFWLYVDGRLVLDLGGVHQACTGSVNFKTGEVISNNTHTTLYALFKASYEAEHPEATAAEVQAYLDDTFETSDGIHYVFKDYTNHKMRMFYMERGAGASNLYMKFNLAAAKPNTVVLTKDITGTERSDYDLAVFPYQIWYKDTEDGETVYRLLPATQVVNYREINSVTYTDRTVAVPHADSWRPAGGTRSYEDVYFLGPGQSADVRLPDGINEYYIVECGISDSIYDMVSANGHELAGQASVGNSHRSDFAISPTTIQDTPRVAYQNHVDEDALRTLSIRKRLYDENGTEITDDPTGFSLRLSLADENGELELANMEPYSVRGPNGRYCTWDVASQRFVELSGNGKDDWSHLTAEEKAAATFYTSVYGAISKIPARHTVEVRDLLVGTKFKVEEYERDIPHGYALVEYDRVDGTYIVDGSTPPNTGEIRDNSDPVIEVHNERGWGITAKKVWSDADFMDDHAPIYVALYTNGTLRADSVRQLANGNVDVYWYFHELDAGTDMDDYEVREVRLGGTFDETQDVSQEGVVDVHAGVTVTPIANNGTLTVNATPTDGNEGQYTYGVVYDEGEVHGAVNGHENVRDDTVYNTREGISIVKEDYDGHPLANVSFTLKDANGHDLGAPSYTSAADGLVVNAYFPEGTYYLTETSVPSGYHALDGPLAITMSNGSITLGGSAGTLALCSWNASNQTITVRNKDFQLQAVKASPEGDIIPGTHFALYRQVLDGNGNPRPDYNPLPGYEDLVSGSDGKISGINEMLPPGTYYVRETQARHGYTRIPIDLCLTITPSGEVTGVSNEYWRIETTSDGRLVTCVIGVTNKFSNDYVISKVDNSGVAVAGAHFSVEKLNTETGQFATYKGLSDITVPATGYHFADGLESGVYRLTETRSPDPTNDFIPLASPLYIKTAVDPITYEQHVTTCDATGQFATYQEMSITGDTITITNQRIPRTSLHATKQWLGPVGSTPTAWPAGKSVTFGLYELSAGQLVAVNRPGTSTHYQVTLDGTTDADELAAGVATFANVVVGPTYVVQEMSVPSGFAVEYTTAALGYEPFDVNGDATISNRSLVTSVSVTKAWDGSVPSDATATMRLFSYDSDPTTAQPVQGVSDITLPNSGGGANAWVATFGGLPTVDGTTGHAINYIVREVSGTSGYAPSYPNGADAATDGQTITNQPQPQSFSFDKVWVGIAATDSWAPGEAIVVRITRSLVNGQTTTPDQSFAAEYRLSADHDGSNPSCTHVSGTTTPTDMSGQPVTPTWDGSDFSLTGLPTRGTIGQADGCWVYAVTETEVRSTYVTTYRIHGSDCPAGTTSVGDGGTIVNTFELAETYELPHTGISDISVALAAALPVVAAAAGSLLARRGAKKSDGGGDRDG